MNYQIPVPDLKKNGLFEGLPLKRLRYLESKLKRVEFPPGTQVIKKGRSGQFLGILESGQVKQENGRSHTQTLTTGQTFGTEMLRYGKPSLSTITTQTETTLWVLNRSDWLTPSSSPRSSTVTQKPRKKKAGWVSLIMTLVILMVALVLGPTLLEYSNNTLPNLLVENGRSDLAEEYLRIGVRLQPKSAKVFGNLGDILVIQGKTDQAIEAYQQAITLDEYLPWIHNNLGVLLLDTDNIDLAVYHLRMALNLNPENTEPYQNLGDAYYSLGLWQAAADAYQGALDLNPTLLDTKAGWGGIVLYENQIEEARTAWEEVLAESPRHPLALQGLGLVSLLEEDPSLALMYLDAAQFVDPDNPITRLYMGLALEALEKHSEAAEEYRLVVEMGSDPELYNLADTLLQVVQE